MLWQCLTAGAAEMKAELYAGDLYADYLDACSRDFVSVYPIAGNDPSV